MWLIAAIELGVPLFLLGAIAFAPQPSKTPFVLFALAMGLALLFCWLVFPWQVTSIWFRQALPVLYLGSVFLGARRIRPPDPAGKSWPKVLGGVINTLMIVFMAVLCWKAIQGYQVPPGAVQLEPPLRDGRYVVGHGGASAFINGHFRVKPQNHALDIIGVNELGARAGVLGDASELGNYEIFGAVVYAPCTGQVLVTVDGLQDLKPGISDRENLAGNHVLLECQDVEVVLAHLKQFSVRVKAGQQVEAGDMLGLVGNSGNTSEPHLHIHAERGGERGVLLNGEAVPMLIDGRYLVRGDQLGPYSKP
jgi:hypothetical protein